MQYYRPLVSIVIPCYNGEGYLADAIHSALGQTYPRCEVIVIDDGSTDSSLDIIKGFGGRVRWETSVNRGGNAARNRGLAIANGEWIQFLDADDMLLPNCVAEKVAFVHETNSIPVCDAINIEQDGSVTRRAWRRVEDDAFCSMVEYAPYVDTPFYPVDALRSVGGFDESLRACQEFELHVRLSIQTRAPEKYNRLPIPLVIHRGRLGSVSSDGTRLAETLATLFQRWAAELRNRGELSQARQFLLASGLANMARVHVQLGKPKEGAFLLRLSRELSPLAWRRSYPRRVQQLLVLGLGQELAEHLFKSVRRLSLASRR